MIVSSRRGRSAAVLAAVWGLALFGVASTAFAGGDITNPAKHPYPVTVKIDGQTYNDGQDTLPGYDDLECTPIPGVQFDFASNQIQYYDGGGDLLATAKWTEWSRISSYDTWLKQQQSAPSSGSTSTGSTTSSPSRIRRARSTAASATPAGTRAGAIVRSRTVREPSTGTRALGRSSV